MRSASAGQLKKPRRSRSKLQELICTSSSLPLRAAPCGTERKVGCLSSAIRRMPPPDRTGQHPLPNSPHTSCFVSAAAVCTAESAFFCLTCL
jgi:hypothetical protein